MVTALDFCSHEVPGSNAPPLLLDGFVFGVPDSSSSAAYK